MLPIPAELHLQVLEYCDATDLLIMKRVNKFIKDLVVGTASLQLKVELFASGQVCSNSTPMGVNPTDCITALRRHQRAWTNVAWSDEIRIRMKGGGCWELYGGVLAQNTEMKTLDFHQLPSQLRGIEQRTWSLSYSGVGCDLNLNIRDFAIDPTQDLLVIMEEVVSLNSGRVHRLHVRTMSTGKAHPAVQGLPILSLPKLLRDTGSGFTIKISGDCVALLNHPQSVLAEFTVWKWTTGELKLNIVGEDIRSFSFFSKDEVLLALLTSGREPLLVLVNILKETNEPKTTEDLAYSYQFHYEEYPADVTVHHLEIHSDPSPVVKPHLGSTLFHQDPSNQLFVIRLWVQKGHAIHCLPHFILSTTIKDICWSSGPAMSKFQWNQWGPEGTRMLQPLGLLPSTVWVCYVYGQKCVVAMPRDVDKEHDFQGCLYDFNQAALRRDNAQRPATEQTVCVTSASISEGGDIFAKEVTTKLPFRASKFTVKDAHRHCQVMCSEDSIILVDSECLEYRVLVF